MWMEDFFLLLRDTSEIVVCREIATHCTLQTVERKSYNCLGIYAQVYLQDGLTVEQRSRAVNAIHITLHSVVLLSIIFYRIHSLALCQRNTCQKTPTSPSLLMQVLTG